MVEIIHNPRCSKSRQTLALLLERGLEPTVIEYLKNPLTLQEIKSVVVKLGLRPIEVIRTQEAEFKSLDIDKADDQQCLQALADYPKILQRPIVIHGKKAAIGRPPEAVLDILD